MQLNTKNSQKGREMTKNSQNSANFCHTERSEVSQNRDFSLSTKAQNDKTSGNSHKMTKKFTQKGQMMKKFAFLAFGGLLCLAQADIVESTNAPAGQSTDLKQLLNEGAAKREQNTTNSRFFEEKAGFAGDSGLMDKDASRDDDERDFRSGKRVVGFGGASVNDESLNFDENSSKKVIIRQND